MVISRSPGQQEANMGRPFSGSSGRLLDHLLEEQGWDRKKTRVTNMVLCQADKLSPQAVECCHPRLLHEIHETGPNTIILAGAEPTKEFTGLSVTAAKGQIFSGEQTADKWQLLSSIKVVATNNPANAIRDASTYPDLVKAFKLALTEQPNEPLPEVRWTEDEREANGFIRAFQDYSVLGLDIETTGLEHSARLTAVGIGFIKDGAYRAVVFGRSLVDNARWREAHLKPLLEQDSIAYITHYGKFDAKVLRASGINATIKGDSYCLSYTLDERPSQAIHKLETLLAERFGWPDYEPVIVKQAKKNGMNFQPEIDKYNERLYKQQVMLAKSVAMFEKAKTEEVQEKRRLVVEKRIATIEAIPKPLIIQLMEAKGTDDPEQAYLPELYHYCGIDVAGTLKLYHVLEPEVRSDGVYPAYERLMVPGSNALANVERNGIYYNRTKAERMRDEQIIPALARLEDEARAATGMLDMQELNLGSTQQLAHYLYDVKGYPDLGTNYKVQRSTDEASRKALMRVVSDSDKMFLEKVDEYAGLAKMKGTYIDGMLERQHSDGRIYGKFNFGTATGRLSSSEPNLQNIPRAKDKDVEAGKAPANIKALFEADEGCVILQADYSQCELRTAAVISGDTAMQTVFAEGRDLHSELARKLYGDNFDENDRFKAKTTNFSIFYGIDSFKLSMDLGIQQSEAKELIATVWQMYPDAQRWVSNMKDLVHKQGYLQTPWGRKRRFQLITRENQHDVEKQAVNYMIQSTASDFCLWSAIELDRTLDSRIARICITVHDSIVLNVAQSYVHDVAHMLQDTMVNAPSITLGWDLVPFKVDNGYGPDYGHIEELELAAA